MKRSLEKTGMGIGWMFGVYWLYSLVLSKYLEISSMQKGLIGIFVLYGFGLSLFLWSIKGVETYNTPKKPVSFQEISLCFLLQFSAVLLVSLVNMVLHLAGSKVDEFSEPLTPVVIFLLLVFNPIVEELVFRKFFAQKLLIYGEKVYILASSFCFAIVHGVSLGGPQVVYTFVLGLLWAYLYAKSGNLLIPIVLHSLSNLFGGVLTQVFEEARILEPYFGFMALLGVVGIILLIKNRKRIRLDGEEKLSNRGVLRQVFTNKGILFHTALAVIAIGVKKFM